MDGDKVERLRERLLQCPVCMDEFRDPRLLPCHHTMCTECINNLLQVSSSGRMFRCPQCRRDVCVPRGGVTELPVNFFVRSLQDELGEGVVVGPCQVCQRASAVSQFRCIDCDLDICHFCIHEHRLVQHKDTAQVNVLRMEVATLGPMQGVANRMCHVHTEEMVQLFCDTCQHPVCVSCSCGEHRRHTVIPLGKKLHQSRDFLQQQLEQLTRERRQVKAWQRQVEGAEVEVRDNTAQTLTAVQQRAQRLHRLVDQMAQAVEDQVQHQEKRQLRDLAACREKVNVLAQRLELGVAFLKGLQEGDVCLELLDAFSTFATELGQVRKNVKSHATVALSDHRFLPGFDTHYRGFGLAKFGSLHTHHSFLRLGSAVPLFQRITFRPTFGQTVMFLLFLAMFFTIMHLAVSCYTSPCGCDSLAALIFTSYLTVAALFAYNKS